MEMSKDILFEPFKDKWTKAIEIKWSKCKWTFGWPFKTQSYLGTYWFL